MISTSNQFLVWKLNIQLSIAKNAYSSYRKKPTSIKNDRATIRSHFSRERAPESCLPPRVALFFYSRVSKNNVKNSGVRPSRETREQSCGGITITRREEIREIGRFTRRR